jgi:hypothetical protein
MTSNTINGNLFTVGAYDGRSGISLTLGNNVTLRGKTSATDNLVWKIL